MFNFGLVLTGLVFTSAASASPTAICQVKNEGKYMTVYTMYEDLALVTGIDAAIHMTEFYRDTEKCARARPSQLEHCSLTSESYYTVVHIGGRRLLKRSSYWEAQDVVSSLRAARLCL